jgi:hypothetical protein
MFKKITKLEGYSYEYKVAQKEEITYYFLSIPLYKVVKEIMKKDSV